MTTVPIGELSSLNHPVVEVEIDGETRQLQYVSEEWQDGRVILVLTPGRGLPDSELVRVSFGSMSEHVKVID